jgi:hypothetical protein
MLHVTGRVSWFGGPDDQGVDADEPLAFIHEIEDAPELFLPYQPAGTTGLARRLDPEKYYIAMRWDYDEHPREMLLKELALVRSTKTGKKFLAAPSDWGPHIDTGRIADISPGLMDSLGIETDDEVEVTFPAPEFEEEPEMVEVIVSISVEAPPNVKVRIKVVEQANGDS